MSNKSKYYKDSNALVLGKMKGDIRGAAIKEFVGLKLKMCSILASNSSECKKVNGLNKNVLAKKGRRKFLLIKNV